MAIVSLQGVVEALDLQSEELTSYLDPDTGEIITFNAEEARVAASGEWEKAPEWMRASLPKIRKALEDDRMLPLPDRVHIDEWRMMQQFAQQDEQCRCRSELEQASHGTGAFRLFKDTLQRLGLEDQWHRYRDTEYKRIAQEWLEAHGVPYR